MTLTCFLVIGVTSILGRDSAPVERFEIVSPVVSNKEGKKDKLAVAVSALASAQPRQTVAGLSEPLPQVFASSTAADIQAPKFAAAPVVMPPLALLGRIEIAIASQLIWQKQTLERSTFHKIRSP